MKRRFFAAIMGVFATGLVACSPGYMKASELESKHQGPSDCEARCVELGMHMGALVLVSDTLPGCVCQPKVEAPKPGEAPKAVEAPQPAAPQPAAPQPAAPQPAAPQPAAPQPASSAAPIGYVGAMAAAVAVRASQVEQQKRKEKSYLPN